MRKLLLMTVVVLLSTATFAQLKIGGGATLGNSISMNQDIGAGLNIRADYSFNKRLSIAPGYTYIIPNHYENIRYTSWQINTDIHYNILIKDNFKFYGLAGLNYTEQKSTFQSLGMYGAYSDNNYPSPTSWSEGQTGLNIGGGINFKKYFGEVKWDSSYNQLGVTFGFFF